MALKPPLSRGQTVLLLQLRLKKELGSLLLAWRSPVGLCADSGMLVVYRSEITTKPLLVPLANVCVDAVTERLNDHRTSAGCFEQTFIDTVTQDRCNLTR